jgi:hypothetical protein
LLESSKSVEEVDINRLASVIERIALLEIADAWVPMERGVDSK